ncbi:MAG: hypothetical protein B6D56_00265 [Candidatus Omnitrophica bacterium 4484_70.1]|nr:MAG: hypothetical protein B6D56_00265 [Candidatus Omnitrophica bacterium 4484_70.1]
MKIVKTEEIFLVTSNEVGKMAQIAGIIAQKDINIRTICAYVRDNQAIFRIITSDNSKAKEALSQQYSNVELKEAVLVELSDKIGELYKLGEKLKEEGIDLEYIYGTTSSSQEAALIFSSDDNEKAIKILSNL